MAQFIVKAKKLNQRSFVPVNLPEPNGIVGTVLSGFRFEGTEAADAEVPNKALGKWYKDNNGHFYWGGGVIEEIPVAAVNAVAAAIVTSTAIVSNAIIYNDFLKGIEENLTKTQGQDTTIIIIDEGISINKDFFDSTISQNVNIDTEPLTSDHGNFIAGIIAGIKNILGITPKAKIISLKYKSDNITISKLLQNLISALEFVLATEGPLVVNISQGFPEFVVDNNPNEKARIISLIEQITNQNNKFIVCSAGDNTILSDDILFPASMNECFSVGCLNEFHKDISISSKLNILSPMVTFTSFDLNFTPKEDVGSSYATAVISSIISCVISANIVTNTPLKKSDILQELKKHSIEKAIFQFGALQSFQFQIT